MSEINKKRSNKSWPLWLIILPVIDLFLLIRYFVQGKNIALFNPKGFIATEQHKLMVITLTVFFIVAVPTMILFYFIAWKYRETNTKAKSEAEHKGGKFLVFSMWAVPTIVMIILVSVMIPATHRLVPQKAIASTAKPLTIQVISLRWKWLFIYPDQGVASVNHVQLPLNVPVTFEMTADEAPMSSFWIPNLGGQLYTMTGHVNRLNLQADKPGIYTGSSAEINGAGFAGMKFTAQADSKEKFDEWVQKTKANYNILNESSYEELLKPSENHPEEFYSAFEPDIYANVIRKYEGAGGHAHE